MGLFSGKRKKRRLGQIIILIVVIVCMGYTLVSTYQLNRSIDQGNRKTVLNYGNQVAARIDDLFDRMDVSLSHLSREIESLEGSTIELVTSELNEYNEVWSTRISGLLYENGESYLSDGSPVLFETKIDVRDVLSYSHNLNISRQNIDGTDMLVFAKACRKQIDGQEMSGVFVAIDITQLEDLLGDYGYGNDSFLGITQEDGTIVWKQGTVYTEEDIANCFEELDQLDLAGGDSVLQMQTRMKVGMDGTLAYTKEGLGFYMSYVPLGTNYWYLLVSARSESIDLTELARQHSITSVVLVIAILVMAAVSVLYLYQRNRSMSRYNEQLKVAADLANEANRANQANRAKQVFLAKVSHDIRTPLNGVMGMITLAKEEYANENACLTYLDKATASAKYLMGLLNDVLDMSQIESGKHTLDEEIVDMKELLQDIESIMEISAKDKGLTFKMDDSALVHRYFRTDRLRLKQILTNLTSNAVKYTQRGGWISLEASEIGDNADTQVVFQVKDNGEGIAPDKLKTIFKPFEQVGTHHRGGVGLGLSIVHSFVELMGGQITVDSQVNEGSTFTVTLPLPLALGTQMEKDAEEEAGNTDLNNVSVLLAEDNDINAEIAISLLERRGAHVTLARDGVIAVDKFVKSQPGSYHVILMDIQMPNMSGLEATEKIRQIDRLDAKEIPILAMTANAFSEQKDEMQQVGMNDFLYKPIDIDVVCRCIKKWIRED